MTTYTLEKKVIYQKQNVRGKKYMFQSPRY